MFIFHLYSFTQEISPSQYHLMASHGQGSISDLTLYTSPSLPNISLGRPAIASHHAAVSILFLLFYFYFFSFARFCKLKSNEENNWILFLNCRNLPDWQWSAKWWTCALPSPSAWDCRQQDPGIIRFTNNRNLNTILMLTLMLILFINIITS